MNDAKSNLPKLDAEEILTGVLRWVEVETPSHDGKAVNRLVDQVEQAMAVLGAKITRTPGRDGFGDILRARTPWGGDKPGILVLSHLDTVHPKGSIDGVLKVRRDGDKVYGPGIYDMKAGAYIAHYALRHLVREGKETPLPITYLYVPEEEIGSPTSRALIEAEAKKNKYVLVTEPAREGGKIVTARKGVARFCVAVKGRPAHAGARHQDGRSAIKEMAKQILRFEALTDYDLGVTASVGLVQGGTGVNVIPAECTAEVDMRMPDAATAERVVAEVLAFKAFDPDCQVTIEGGLNRPPYEKFEGIQKLFDHAKGLAANIGFELKDMKTGGGSDGNFTAALGIPTLDGLGAVGEGAHSPQESILLNRLPDRVALIAQLLLVCTEPRP